MSGDERGNWFDELMDRSSLGAEGVYELGGRTSDDTLAGILHRRATEEMLDQLDPTRFAVTADDQDEEILGSFDSAAWRPRSW